MIADRKQKCAGGLASWSISLPNGMYTVAMSFADPSFPGARRNCTLQCGNLGLIEVPRETANTVTRTAAVTNGRLTFAGGYAIGCHGINAISIASIGSVPVEESSGVAVCPPPPPPLPPSPPSPPTLPPSPPSSPKPCKRGRDCGAATWAGAMMGGVGGVFLILAIALGGKKKPQRPNNGAPTPAAVTTPMSLKQKSENEGAPTPAAVTTPRSLKQKSELIRVELDIPSGTIKEIIEMAASKLGIDIADKPLPTAADECMAALHLPKAGPAPVARVSFL
jgi:hypothetical protein